MVVDSERDTLYNRLSGTGGLSFTSVTIIVIVASDDIFVSVVACSGTT